MNVLLPSSSSGSGGVQGAGEGPAYRRDGATGDFAATLAETAGESGDGARRGEGRGDATDEATRVTRAVRRSGTREEYAGEEQDSARDAKAEPSSGNVVRLHSKNMRARAQMRDVSEIKANSAPSETVVATPTPAHDALAALGAEMTAKSEATSSTTDAVASIRSMLLSSERPTKARAGAGEDPGAALAGDPGNADEPEASLQPVRVVRQETHFQPVNLEARRAQIAQAASGETPAELPSGSDVTEALRVVAQKAGAEARATAAGAPEAVAPVAPAMASGSNVVPGTVGVQIADRVQQALSGPFETSAPAQSAGASFEPDTRQTFSPALRTIKLELSPAALGAVTIVVTRDNEGLRIHLAAEQADTVGTVENDRGTLTARLAGAGYSVTELTVARMAGQGGEGEMRDQGGRQGAPQDQQAGTPAREGAAHSAGQEQGRGSAERHNAERQQRGAPRDAAGAPQGAGVSSTGRFRPI